MEYYTSKNENSGLVSAPACERNSEPILAIIRKVFTEARTKKVLEVGSGTGQHAAFFSTMLPHLIWQTSDLTLSHDTIKTWLETTGIPFREPLTLDVDKESDWNKVLADVGLFDGIFTANILHIIGWPSVVSFIQHSAQLLSENGDICMYGPFNYHGNFTSESNANFDAYLKARDPASGIRNFEDIVNIAQSHSLVLIDDYEMPA